MKTWKPNWKAASPKVQRLHAQEGLIEAVGVAIREMLAAKEMNQVSLAKALDKTEGHVSRLLNGRNLTLRTFADICFAIGVKATAKFIACAPALMIVASTTEIPSGEVPANTEVYMQRPRLRIVAQMVAPPNGTVITYREVA